MMLIFLTVCRQYRHDIAIHFDKTNHHKLSDARLKDKASEGIRLSWDGIKNAIQGEHVTVKPHGKLIATKQSELIYWLFGEGDMSTISGKNGKEKEMKRYSFHKMAFRSAYFLGRRILLKFGGMTTRDFGILFQKTFFTEHWVVPYPDTNGCLSSTTKGEMGHARRWFHVAPSMDTGIYDGPPFPGYPEQDQYHEWQMMDRTELGKMLKALRKHESSSQGPDTLRREALRLAGATRRG